jgi:hypothetical protein
MYSKQSIQAVNAVAIPIAPAAIPKGSAIVKVMSCRCCVEGGRRR